MSGQSSAESLLLFIERVERLNAEITDLQADRKDVLSEAKGQGFDVPTIKRIVGERKKDPDELRAAQDVYETYMAALGQLADTPLGIAAAERAADAAARAHAPKLSAIEKSRAAKAARRQARGAGLTRH